jgi:hypothetical protein
MHENCNPTDCPLTPRVDALERANEQHGKTHRDVYNRLNSLERGEAAQAEQYKAILEKLDGLTQKHDALNAKLSELEAKPGKRWEAMAEKAIWAVCAAVIAFLLGRVGL